MSSVALHLVLGKGEALLVRTPNMEGPCPTSSLFVTLAHEYGFRGSSRASLLEIFNFDDVTFVRLDEPTQTFKQSLGAPLR